jgi:TonB family protein
MLAAVRSWREGKSMLTMVALLTSMAGATAKVDPPLVLSSGQMKFSSTKFYPKESLEKHEEGDASFTVTIATDGKPKDCVITKSTGSPRLDKATCEMVTSRSNYTPDHDDEGKPKESKFSGSVHWGINRSTRGKWVKSASAPSSPPAAATPK